MKFCRRRK